MSTNISQRFRLHNRDAMQSYLLLGFGVVCLLGALLLRLNYRVYPLGLLLFGLGLLVAATVNPSDLMIAGLFFTLSFPCGSLVLHCSSSDLFIGS